ncbi:hypothetical protein L6R29_14655 [Myxococcota bacterium]|nr:hypothetical protein [Myxococcota bacterium]
MGGDLSTASAKNKQPLSPKHQTPYTETALHEHTAFPRLDAGELNDLILYTETALHEHTTFPRLDAGELNDLILYTETALHEHAAPPFNTTSPPPSVVRNAFARLSFVRSVDDDLVESMVAPLHRRTRQVMGSPDVAWTSGSRRRSSRKYNAFL